jgi:N-acetylneuraminic acid mutarotase
VILCLSSLALTAAGQQWAQTTSLPDGYSGQSLGYWNGFLYQAGGTSNGNGILDGTNVFYALVYTNGTIGTWNMATPLPDAVCYHAGVVANSFLYILGGYHFNEQMGFVITNTVYYTKINPDGSVGAWQTANPLPDAVFYLSAAAWNGRIYVAGGCDANNFTNAIWSAQVEADGSLSPWVAQAPLPDSVYTQSEVANGTLYVLGGSIDQGTEVTSNVCYSRINADGTLSDWNQTTPMPQPLGNLGAVAAGGKVFVIGGFNGSVVVNVCYIAAVAGDGTVGTWSSGPAFPKPLYQGGIPIAEFGITATDSYIFLTGGTQGDQNYSAVFSLALPAPPTTPTLAKQRFGTNGAFQLQLTSSTNTGFGVLASTNLTAWTNIGWGFTGTNGSLLLQDTNAAQFPTRFYRAYWPLP